VPNATTLYRVLQWIEIQQLEAYLAAFVGQLAGVDVTAGSVITATGKRLSGQAVDRKTVTGESRYGTTVHLMSVARHENSAYWRK